jgi:hypothetical protein
MKHRTRSLAAFFATLTLLPALAAGRPACCVRPSAAPAPTHSCCLAKVAAQATGPKSCCKTPPAPMPETKVRPRTAAVMETPAMDSGGLAQASIELPAVSAMRLARLAHHAEAPDESPPDLLQRTHVLLI